MARPEPSQELDAIEEAVRRHPGVGLAELVAVLGDEVPRRTLQHRLKSLVDDGRLVREGDRRGARYRTPEAAVPPAPAEAAEAEAIALSPEGEEIRANVRRPRAARTPAGYNRELLDAYRRSHHRSSKAEEAVAAPCGQRLCEPNILAREQECCADGPHCEGNVDRPNSLASVSTGSRHTRS